MERKGFVPLYMDIVALCENLCCSESTIDNWVRQGIIPPARRVGGKRLWKTEEVIDAIDNPEAESFNERMARQFKASIEAEERERLYIRKHGYPDPRKHTRGQS